MKCSHHTDIPPKHNCDHTGTVGESFPMSDLNPLKVPKDAISKLQALISDIRNCEVGYRSVSLLRAVQSAQVLMKAHIALEDIQNQEEWEKLSEGGAYTQALEGMEKVLSIMRAMQQRDDMEWDATKEGNVSSRRLSSPSRHNSINTEAANREKRHFSDVMDGDLTSAASVSRVRADINTLARSWEDVDCGSQMLPMAKSSTGNAAGSTVHSFVAATGAGLHGIPSTFSYQSSSSNAGARSFDSSSLLDLTESQIWEACVFIYYC